MYNNFKRYLLQNKKFIQLYVIHLIHPTINSSNLSTTESDHMFYLIQFTELHFF